MSGLRDTGRVGAAVGADGVGSAWRGFFWAACVFALTVGGIAMLSPAATLDSRIVGVLIFAFGIVYLAVARDPARFAPVLWAGVIGKIGFIALIAPELLDGSANLVIGAALAVDAVFAAGFLWFLLTKADHL